MLKAGYILWRALNQEAAEVCTGAPKDICHQAWLARSLPSCNCACRAQMENMKNMGSKLPSNAAGRLVRTVLIGGAAVYGITHSLFNVEGGHRAIVFNRFGGLKDTACRLR